MESVRIYEIPACRMVSSQCGMFGSGAMYFYERHLYCVEKCDIIASQISIPSSRRCFYGCH